MAQATAVLHREVFGPHDQLWAIAGRNWRRSGYGTISDLVDAIRLVNPLIVDWRLVAPDSVILVPYLSRGPR